jgi:hypothetical protein
MTDDPPKGENPLKDENAELESLRSRLDHLRVQANLGRKELRDKLGELERVLDPAYRKAKQRLAERAGSGADEVRVLARSLQAGWDQLVRTHRELSREADRERSERPDRK